MKIKHILIAIASLFTIDSLNNDIFINYQLNSAIRDILNILLGICVTLLIYTIIRNAASYQAQQEGPTPQKSRNIQEIEQELDEIEASLNAVSSNDKVTPIWNINRKEP